MGKDNVKPEFLAKSPAGKVPVLDTPSGSLFESNAIARYVAKIRRDTELAGKTFFEQAQVDAWMDFCAQEVELPAVMWIYPILGYLPADAATSAKAQADLTAALKALEKHLLLRTYLVGESITLADIALVATLYYPFKLVLDGKAREALPSVTRWFVTCANQKEFLAVLGDVVLADTVMAPGGKGAAAAAPAAKKEAAKKEAKKEEAAPKAKEEKKPKKKDDDDDDGGDEMAAFLEPKKPDFAAALPPTPLNLDEWKRTYSNSRTEGYYPSMQWLWANLDREGWTLWRATYKYNDENKVDWQTSNLISGFLQRCDEIRKYAFGCMAVLGAAAPFQVSGIWLLRGKEIAPMLEANPDAEYYEWTKITDDEETRKLIADYWCATEVINGQTIYDSKIFSTYSFLSGGARKWVGIRAPCRVRPVVSFPLPHPLPPPSPRRVNGPRPCRDTGSPGLSLRKGGQGLSQVRAPHRAPDLCRAAGVRTWGRGPGGRGRGGDVRLLLGSARVIHPHGKVRHGCTLLCSCTLFWSKWLQRTAPDSRTKRVTPKRPPPSPPPPHRPPSSSCGV